MFEAANGEELGAKPAEEPVEEEAVGGIEPRKIGEGCALDPFEEGANPSVVEPLAERVPREEATAGSAGAGAAEATPRSRRGVREVRAGVTRIGHLRPCLSA